MEYNALINELKEKVSSGVEYVIVIPTYNEANNIIRLISDLEERLTFKYEVLIIDDNSPDGTSAQVEELQSKYSNLHLLVRDSKQGLGSAYQLGFSLSYNAGFEFVLSMDADLSHQAVTINKMISYLDEYDLIIGSRFVKGAELVGFCFIRRLISRVVNLMSNLLLDMKVEDVSSSFRCYRRSVFDNINFVNRSMSKRYIFAVEILFYIVKHKLKIKEVPITFAKRTVGESKMSFAELIVGFYTIVSLAFKRS